MVAGDVAYQDVSEAHGFVPAEPVGDRVRRSDQQPVVIEPAVALGEDRIDVGPSRGIGRGEMDVAAQDRKHWPIVDGGCSPVEIELLVSSPSVAFWAVSQPSPSRP